MTHTHANFGKGASKTNLTIQQRGKEFIFFSSFLKNLIFFCSPQKLHLLLESKKSNPPLQENAQGLGETHCNQATQCIMKTVNSTNTDPNVVVNGNANTMVSNLEKGTNPSFKLVDQQTAETNAANGGLSIIGWKNPTGGHGHILTYSVGDNILKGKVSNIGPAKYTGFTSLNGAISKTKPKLFFIYTPPATK